MHTSLNLNRSTAATVLSLLLSVTSANAQRVLGSVRAADAPVPGTVIGVELDGQHRAGPPSDADGAFVLDLKQLYARNVSGNSDLLLQFSAPGFVSSARSMRVSHASAAPLAVTLLPDSGGSALSADDQQKLAPFVNPSGSGALMLVPYDLPTDLSTPRLTERLRFNIERLVVTYVQAALGIKAPTLSVRLMPLDGAHDQDRLRAVGRHVNALAVVSGNGDRTSANELAVSSSYVIPPQNGPVKPLVAFVDDRVPTAQLASPELHRQLNRLWGRVTILAMAVRDLNAAPPSSSAGTARADALKRVRAYLVAERANTGPRNAEFIGEMDALLALIAREVKP
jgi:hypothetical protein